MAKSVAARWLKSASRDEYRFVIFGFQNHVKAKRFASSLRVLRDKTQIREASSESGDGFVNIPVIPDLGVRERGDVVEVWSSNVESLRHLARWAEATGLNTDFIW
jgi:hypothetical protein